MFNPSCSFLLSLRSLWWRSHCSPSVCSSLLSWCCWPGLLPSWPQSGAQRPPWNPSASGGGRQLFYMCISTGVKVYSSSSDVHLSSCQVGRHHSEDHHAGHVVCGRLPLDDGERSEGITCRSTHPHPSPPLFLLWCHPRHHDDVIHRHEGWEQRYPALGQ